MKQIDGKILHVLALHWQPLAESIMHLMIACSDVDQA